MVNAKSTLRTYLTACLVLAMFLGCKGETPKASISPSNCKAAADLNDYPVKLSSIYLPNLVQVHQRVISGGLPEGDAAFEELVELGVKTIISVDGKSPDLVAAGKHGLRYIHLPHGYDGIPEQRVKELAKAVRELEGPIYIHCHHGKHRSPAAASAACVSAGLIPPTKALSILELAGTSSSYQGLFEVAGQALAFEDALLDELDVEFKQVQEIPPMAEAMVHISHVHERLGFIAACGWKTPQDHPDLKPAHEALLLRELFTELLRTDEVARQSSDFQDWLRTSEATARELERELVRSHVAGVSNVPVSRLNELAIQISADCKACHTKYRDHRR